MFANQRFCYSHFSPPPILAIFGASRLGVLALYLGVQKHFAGGDSLDLTPVTHRRPSWGILHTPTNPLAGP